MDENDCTNPVIFITKMIIFDPFKHKNDRKLRPSKIKIHTIENGRIQ